jgi:hypothetical protein
MYCHKYSKFSYEECLILFWSNDIVVVVVVVVVVVGMDNKFSPETV